MRCNNLNHQQEHNLGLWSKLVVCRRSGDSVPISEVMAKTTPNKPRQRGHAISTLSLATTYLYFIYLLDAIVTSFVLLYHPLVTPSPFSLLSSPLMLIQYPYFYIFLVWDSRPAVVGQSCRPMPSSPNLGPRSYYFRLVKLG